MSANAATRAFDGGTLSARSFASRAAALSRPQRAVYRRVLQSVIEGVERPLYALSAAEIAPLIAADLIQTDEEGRLSVAYSFSGSPTRHRVAMKDGRSYHAMCAIDALGIPYMLGERAAVESREPASNRIILVKVDPGGEPTWEPDRAVVLAAFGEGSCLAQAACPHINLFVSADAANRYLDARPLRGRVLSIPDATEAGRWAFGDLLASLEHAEAG
jgi:hypothetical protein